MSHGGVRSGAGARPVNAERGAKTQCSVSLYVDTWGVIETYAEQHGVNKSVALQEMLDSYVSGAAPAKAKRKAPPPKDPEQLCDEHFQRLIGGKGSIVARARWMRDNGYA